MRAEPPPDQLRSEADRILDDDRYRPPGESFFERALDWLGDRVDDLFHTLAGDGIGTLAMWVLLGALAGLVGWLLSRLGGGAWTMPRRSPAPVTVRTGDPTYSADEWRSRAIAAEQAGDMAEAVRCHWRARVADLADGGIVDERPSATAGEYRRDVAAGDATAAREFDGPTEVFEDVWYGSSPAGPETVAAVRGTE